MENASKALIMAGQVLIGIIVVSLLMIMVNSLTNYQQVHTQSQRETQTIQFNNQLEGYDRNVRGNELYSLVNKIVDYNKRKSIIGTDSGETGVDYGFQEMTLNIVFPNNNNKELSRGTTNNLFTESHYTFNAKKNINSTIEFKSTIENLFGKELPECYEANRYRSSNKKFKYSEDKLIRLIENYDSIFNYCDRIDEFKGLNYNVTEEKKIKIEVFESFNNAFGEEYFPLYTLSKERVPDSTLNNYINYLEKNREIWEDLTIYFEYDQFKRGIFKCQGVDSSWKPINESGIKYDHDTGRVIEMTFVFTGQFD